MELLAIVAPLRPTDLLHEGKLSSPLGKRESVFTRHPKMMAHFLNLMIFWR